MAVKRYLFGKHFASGGGGGLVASNPQTILGAVTVNNPGSAATVTVYDDTSAVAGHELAILGGTLGTYYPYNLQVQRGIYVSLGGTTQADVTVSFG